MAAHALADGTDAVATWRSRRRLPGARARFSTVAAAGSLAISLSGVLGLRDDAPVSAPADAGA